MFFLIISMIIGIAASAITIKTLVGYTSLKWRGKLILSAIILFCWFGHNAVWFFRHHQILSPTCYAVFSTLSYIALGLGFILLCLLLFRDFIWFASYGLAKITKPEYCDKINPYNNFYLNTANIITIIVAVILTGWSVYEALRLPAIQELTLQNAKIKEPLRIVQMNDLHVNRTTSVKKIEKLVQKVNELEPDVVVLVGDIVDERQPE